MRQTDGRIFRGTLRQASDRLEIVFAPSLPWWGWLLLGDLLLCVLWRVAAGGGLEYHLVAGGAWAFPIMMVLFGIENFSFRPAGLLVPRRRLVLARAGEGDYRRSRTFLAEVDGVPIGPASRRGLFVIRHSRTVVNIVVIGETAIVVQDFPQGGGMAGGMLRQLQRAATVALLRAERGGDNDGARDDSVSAIRAICRVLDLTPAQTGGDVTPSECQSAGRRLAPPPPPNAFDRWRAVITCALFLPLLWSMVVWIDFLPSLLHFAWWLAALLFASILVVPLVLLFNGVRTVFYVRPLRDRITAMIAKANDGPGLDENEAPLDAPTG